MACEKPEYQSDQPPPQVTNETNDHKWVLANVRVTAALPPMATDGLGPKRFGATTEIASQSQLFLE